MIYHYFQNWADSDAFAPNFRSLYAKENNGASITDRWSNTVMPLARNHWDTYCRIVETTFPTRRD